MDDVWERLGKAAEHKKGERKYLLNGKELHIEDDLDIEQYVVADRVLNGSNGKLYLCNEKGVTKEIGTDVTWFSYVNSECIVYVDNGSLFVYTGRGESKCISKTVTQYSCME